MEIAPKCATVSYRVHVDGILESFVWDIHWGVFVEFGLHGPRETDHVEWDAQILLAIWTVVFRQKKK